MVQCKLQADRLRTDSKAAGNKGLAKSGRTVLYASLVLSINSSACGQVGVSNARLRQAPNRYKQA